MVWLTWANLHVAHNIVGDSRGKRPAEFFQLLLLVEPRSLLHVGWGYPLL